jgi:hypothetical protein
MYPRRHALRFAVYGGALSGWSSRSRLLRLATLGGGLAYTARPLLRAMSRLEDPAERVRATVVVPALMAWIDSAKMAGYLAGLPAARDRA